MWHYCEKCKEIVKHCEHDILYVIKTSDHTEIENDQCIRTEPDRSIHQAR